MLRRDFIQAFLQAFLFALFGRFHRALPAPVVAKSVELMLFRGGKMHVSLMIKGWEVTDEWRAAVREAVEDSPEFKEMIA